MKILKHLFLIAFILVVLAVGGLFIFIKTFDIAKYKPMLLEKAEKALGRKVDFTDVSLDISLSQGIRADIKGFRIAENPAFGAGDFVSVDEVFVGVDVLAYLTKKEISLTAITVQSPHITLIKAKGGGLNAQTLAIKEGAPASNGATPAKTAALPLILVNKLELKNGTLDVIDRSQSPELKAQISHLDLTVNHFSLNEPFDISLKMAAFGATQNISVAGKAKLDLAKSGVEISDLKTTVDLSQLDMAQLRALPGLKSAPLPQTMKGTLEATIKQLSAGAGGLGAIVMDIALEKGVVRMADVSPGIGLDIPALDVRVTDFSLDGKPFKFKLSAAYASDSSNIAVEGAGAFNQATGAVHLTDTLVTADLAKFSFAKLREDMPALKAAKLPDALTGQFKANLKELALAQGKITALNAGISLAGGSVSFKEIAPGVALNITSLDCSLENLAPGKMAAFTLKAAYLSDTPNILGKGGVAFNPATQMFQVKNASVTTDLASFSLEKLKASLAALKDAPLPEALRGQVNLELVGASAGGGQPAMFSGSFTLDKGYAKLSQLPAPVDNLSARASFTQTNLNVDSLSLNLGKGSVTAKGKVEDYPGKQFYAIGLGLQNISLADLADPKAAPVQATGLLTGDMALSGAGFDAASISKNLTGQGKMEITEGKLLNFNILSKVLDKITIVPNFRQIAEAKLPRVWQQKLQQKDTIITRAAAQTIIQNGVATITPIEISAEGFTFQGAGNYGLAEKNYALQGTFVLAPEMAASIASTVPEMGYLMNETKQISFPLKVEGKGAEVSFAPEMKAIAVNALKNKGAERLGKLLDKKLGGKLPGGLKQLLQPGAQQAEPQATPDASAQPQQPGVPAANPAQQPIPAPQTQAPQTQAPAQEQPLTKKQKQQQLLNGLIQQFGH